jgi:hypothetical protein
MSIHTLFKSILNSTTQTISKQSGAEIAFANWKKEKDLENENNAYLTELYIKHHESTRESKKLAYEMYVTESDELTNNYYKTHKNEYLNKLLARQIPEIFFEKDSYVYTKYSLPNSINNA